MKEKLVSAIGWSVGLKLAFQIVTWAMTLIVIRILSPDDYGLMTMSQIFTTFMMGFCSLGFGDALVQRAETPKPLVARVFGLLLLVSLALTALLALAAYPLADWYGDQRLVLLIQVSSLGFVFNVLMLLPRAFLTKSLRVRPMFIIELSSGLVGAATVIVLAYRDYGAWALMLGWVAANIAKVLGFAILTPHYYVWPRFKLAGIGPLLSFGMYRTLEYTAWVIITSVDVLVISRWLGPTALGVYAVSTNFAAMPLSKIAPILNSTAFPAFALVQGQPAEARFYALKSLRMMAAISVPVFFGIAATAPEVVDLVFGPNWLAAKPVLGILALATTFRAILLIIPNYLQGIGDSRAGFWCTAAGAVIFIPGFVVGCHWGIVGVAYAWLIGYPIVYLATAVIASRRGGLEISAMMSAPIRPMVAGFMMMGAVAGARLLIPATLPEPSRFAVLVAVGAAAYGFVLFIVFRPLAMEFVRLLNRADPLAV